MTAPVVTIPGWQASVLAGALVYRDGSAAGAVIHARRVYATPRGALRRNVTVRLYDATLWHGLCGVNGDTVTLRPLAAPDKVSPTARGPDELIERTHIQPYIASALVGDWTERYAARVYAIGRHWLNRRYELWRIDWPPGESRASLDLTRPTLARIRSELQFAGAAYRRTIAELELREAKTD